MIETLKPGSIILTDERNKREILKAMSEKSLFLSLHFVNPLQVQTQIAPGYFFDMLDKEGIDYHLAKSYLWLFDYLSDDQTYQSDLLSKLQKIKQRLMIEELLLDVGPLEVPLVYQLDQMPIPSYVKAQEIIHLSFWETLKKNISLTIAKKRSDGYLSLFDRVTELLETGIDINHIVILNTTTQDDFQLQKIFGDAGLPIHINKQISIRNHPTILRFKKILQTDGYIAAKLWLEDTFSRDETSQENLALVDLLNHYKDSDLTKHPEVLLAMTDELTIKSDAFGDCLNFYPIDNFPYDEKTYYLLTNYDDEHLPKLPDPASFLSDAEVQEAGLPSREMIFNHALSSTKRLLESIQHLELFLTVTDPEMTRIARVIDPKNIKQAVYHYPVKPWTYLDGYQKLIYAKARHDFLTYYIDNDHYHLLKGQYEDQTSIYHHTFSGIEDKDLLRLIKRHPSITGAKLESYQLCRFQYLAKYLLDLDPFETSTSAFLGTLSHKVLEHFTRDKAASLDDIVDNHPGFPESEAYKEKLYKKALKEDLAALLPVVLGLHEKTAFKEIETEKAFRFPYDKDPDFEISGIMDKVMVQRNQFGNHYVVFIDYKLSSKDFRMEQFEKRLELQLPMYLYAYRQLEKSKFQAVGLFYQTTSIGRQKRSEKEIQKHVALSGVVLNHKDALLKFADLSYIKGVDLKNDGDFKKSNRVLDASDFAAIETTMAALIKEMTMLVKQGHFEINPLPAYGAKKDSVSCEYCPFFGLCYNKNKKAGV